MTSTEHRKTVRLTTSYVRNGGKDKPVVVCLHQDRIILKLKRERRSYSLSAAFVFTIAVQSWVEATKARRKAERAAKRKGKR